MSVIVISSPADIFTCNIDNS